MRYLWIVLTVLWPGIAAAQEDIHLGLYGRVDSTDPLVVAGVAVTVPEALPLISPLGQGAPVQAGDILALRLRLEGDRLTAVRMLEIFPVVGPVTSVAEGTAIVMGTEVHVPQGADVRRGRRVALSGFWSGQRLIATNVRGADGGFGHLTGVVDAETQTIGGSELRGAKRPEDGFGGGLWILSGAPEEGGLRVQLLGQGLFGGPVAMALWQGHATAPVASQTYQIFGTAVTGTARDAQMPQPGALITRCAVADRVVDVAPEGLDLPFAALGCARHIPAE